MQKKAKKAVSVATMASLLITSSAISANVKAAGVTPPESPRLWGADRYETAVKVSQTGWTSGSDYAVVASGEGYADALCAAPLAKANNAPILLTQKGVLNQNTLNELKRLKVKHVYIVGGQGVVSQSVEDKIKTEVTSDIQRLWGQDRYETAVKVAEKLGTTGKIVLASGSGYADALSAAPVAAIEGMPILLTESKTLSKPTADYIKSKSGITKTYVIGGYASVSDAAMASVPGAQRLGGSDRYETNATVINAFAGDFDFKNAYIALGDGPNGNEFADALAGSALAAKNKNPLIITSKVLNDSTKNLIKTKLTTSSTLTILGGTANLSDSLVSDMNSARGTASSSGGSSSGGSSSSTNYLNTSTSSLGTINGDAYVTTSGVELKNGTINGTLYLNPGNGVNDSVILDNVTADNVVIQSGGSNSIHFKGNTRIKGKLKIQDPTGVRVVTEGNTQIADTEVSSQAILEATAGSFGNVIVAPTSTDRTVKLVGCFNRPVEIKGNVDLVTTASTAIPALLVSQGVNANAINVTGNGIIVHIQVKSENVTLKLGKDMCVVEKIEVLKGAIIDALDEIKSKIEEKNSVDDMSTDVGNATFEDLTGEVAGVYVSKMNDYLTAHPTLDKYLDVTTGSTIELKITNSKWTTIEEMFATAKNEAQNDTNKFYSRVDMLRDLLDMPFVAKTDIGGKTIAGYLEAIYPSYFFGPENDRKLEAGLIGNQLKSGELNYAGFITNLKDKIRQGGGNGPTLAFKLSSEKDLVIDRIVKDNSTVYSKTASKDDNVKFLDTNNIDDLVGTYTIYSGKYTVKIKITK